jgi:hypothetical protein
VYDGLPADERGRAVIVTRNYGEAGALERFGPEYGLPKVYSGHNAYAGWGRPPAGADVVIVLGSQRDGLPLDWVRDNCQSASIVGRSSNSAGLKNAEQNRPIWLCRGLNQSWDQIWPTLTWLG